MIGFSDGKTAMLEPDVFMNGPRNKTDNGFRVIN